MSGADRNPGEAVLPLGQVVTLTTQTDVDTATSVIDTTQEKDTE